MTDKEQDTSVDESQNIKTGLVLDPKSGAHPLGLSTEESAFLYSGKDGTELAEADPYRAILDQILNANTPDAVLTPIEAQKIGAYVGVCLELFGFQLQKSEYDTGSPFYAAMQCRDVDKDEPVVITSEIGRAHV